MTDPAPHGFNENGDGPNGGGDVHGLNRRYEDDPFNGPALARRKTQGRFEIYKIDHEGRIEEAVLNHRGLFLEGDSFVIAWQGERAAIGMRQGPEGSETYRFAHTPLIANEIVNVAVYNKGVPEIIFDPAMKRDIPPPPLPPAPPADPAGALFIMATLLIVGAMIWFWLGGSRVIDCPPGAFC